MSRKSVEAERRARAEQLRLAQRRADRRRTMLLLAVTGTLTVVLIGAVVWVILDTAEDRDLGRIGLTATAAACDDVVVATAEGTSVHVGPGTDQADVTTVEYDSVPPTHGEHYATPEYPARAFYTADDRPQLETLVHNLEHGYTIVWYTDDISAEQRADLEKAATLARKDPNTAGKVIVTAWDESRGAYPAGRTVGITHWGAKQSYKQMCGGFSGAVLEDFIADHPWSDSPEPNAA